MAAVHGLKGEKRTVKHRTEWTVFITVCLMIATAAPALASGAVSGWDDYFSAFYGTSVPAGAAKNMEENGEETYTVGPVTFTVNGLYCDGHIMTASTHARLAEGTGALLTGNDPFDPIGANGENGQKTAARLGVDPDLSWVDAARQLSVPLYSVRAVLEAPEACARESMEDVMFNEDGSLTYFSIPLMNGKLRDEQADCRLYLKVQEINADDPAHQPEALEERREICIARAEPVDSKEYEIPGDILIRDVFRLESVRAELMPAGLYLTSTLTALADLSEDQAMDILYHLEFVRSDGERYPMGISLSGGLNGFDTLPVVELEDMISADGIPDVLGLILPDEDWHETMVTLELKTE